MPELYRPVKEFVEIGDQRFKIIYDTDISRCCDSHLYTYFKRRVRGGFQGQYFYCMCSHHNYITYLEYIDKLLEMEAMQLGVKLEYRDKNMLSVKLTDNCRANILTKILDLWSNRKLLRYEVLLKSFGILAYPY